MLKNRRRSLSASRTIDHTVNLVGRIGASLRLSARKRAKVSQYIIHYIFVLRSYMVRRH